MKLKVVQKQMKKYLQHHQKEKPFALIAINLDKPKQNGLDLCRKIKNKDRAKITLVFVYLLTKGSSMVKDVMQSGVNEFVLLPLSTYGE